MGYDMRWRKVDGSEGAAVAAAREVWNAAIKARDELPETEKGQFNGERAKELGDWDAHEVFDGRTQRYREAQDRVMAASRKMYAAEQSYFRLNVWGMGAVAGVMDELGMLFDDGPHPEFPEPEAYGTTHDEVERVEYPEEFGGEPALSTEAAEKARAYIAEVDRILAWHGHMDTPGIPQHKFSSNDGWIVLPVECQAALGIYTAKLAETGQDAMHNLIDNRIGNRGIWGRWLAYLNGAITHDGFEVH